MLDTFAMQQGGTQYRRLVGAFQRIFGATIFFGTDSQRERAAVVHRARFNSMSEARIWYSRDPDQPFGSRGELGRRGARDGIQGFRPFGKSIRADMAQLLKTYLTEAHRDAPGTGCAMGALLGDMTRGSKSARALFTALVKRSVALSSAFFPSNQPGDKRGRGLQQSLD